MAEEFLFPVEGQVGRCGVYLTPPRPRRSPDAPKLSLCCPLTPERTKRIKYILRRAGLTTFDYAWMCSDRTCLSLSFSVSLCFLPPPHQVTLSVGPKDTARALCEGAFRNVEFSDIIQAFAAVLGNPLSPSISKRHFDYAMRQLLLHVMKWPEQLQTEMSYFLSQLFYAFGQGDHEYAATDELLVGLSLLVSGSKTYKLQSFWSHFANAATSANGDEQETVQQAELARLLSALLTGLFSICRSSNGDYDEELVAEAVHRRALRTAMDIFRELGVDDDAPITFDMFGSWYNEFGFEVVQWLELLDLSKWPQAAPASQQAIDAYSGAQMVPNYDDDDEGGEQEDDDEGNVRLTFDFPAPQHTNSKVSITDDDVERLAQIISLTEINEEAPERVAGLFLDAADENIISREQFNRCVRQLVPLDRLVIEADLDEKETLTVIEELTSRFSIFFFAFERHPGRGVKVDELAAGFSLLCEGNKSEKLAHAWQLIANGSKDGRLTRRGLWRFLRSFLQMLLAVSGKVTAASATELSATADSGAVWTAALVFAEAELEYEHSVTFDEFAAWYTNGGFRAASWFELLDLKKWVMADGVAPAGGGAGYAGDSDEDSDGVDAAIEAADTSSYPYAYQPLPGSAEGESEGEGEEESEDGAMAEFEGEQDEPPLVCFTFKLTGQGMCLDVTNDDVDFVTKIVTSSYFYELQPERVAEVLMKHSEYGGASLTKSGYNQAVRELLPRVAECDAETVKFLTYALSNVYFSFVPEGEERAPFSELATALSLFCLGSKSAKLQHGFSIFAWAFDKSQDDLETLDGSMLRRFLASILGVLFSCCHQTAKLPLPYMRSMLAVAVEELATRIMYQSSEVTFDDFGEWYNEEGCELAPWLELLDLKKWQPVTPTGASIEDEDDEEEEGDDDEEEDDEEDDEELEAHWRQMQQRQREAQQQQDAVDDMYGLGAAQVRFSFVLLDMQGEPSPFVLRISDADIAGIRNLVTRTRLCTKHLSSVCKPLLEAADNGLLDKGSFDRCVLSEEDNCGMKALRPLTINICFRLILHVIQVREEIGAPGLDFQGGAEHVWGTPVRNILQLRGGR